MHHCNCNRKYPKVKLYPIHCICGCKIYEDKVECSNEKPSFPTITKQATNFISSSIKHVFTGMKTVPEEVKQQRLDICNSCEHYQNNRCTQCGCFMNIKTEWAEQECPLKKWLKHETDNNSN